jgi:sec-independent protein translocase protein TatB
MNERSSDSTRASRITNCRARQAIVASSLVFGLSFFEVVVIGIVALLAVGPRRLPAMLRDLGNWLRKLRKMTIDVRAQTGIDDILRAEGLHGGLSELRGLMRGGVAPAPAPYRPYEEPRSNVDIDVAREYPPEGADAKGAIPDDLVDETPTDERPSKPKNAPIP